MATTISDDMAVWVPSTRCRDVPPTVCDMLASEHGMSFRASVVISSEANSTPSGRRDDSFPPEVLVSSSQRFTTEAVQLAASSSIQGIKVIQPCYELEDLCLSSTQMQRLALRGDVVPPPPATAHHHPSKDPAVTSPQPLTATTTTLPTVVSLRSLQQYAVPFLIQHSQHQHNRRAVENVQRDLVCQSALVVAGPVSSGKSTAAAIALSALLYNRKSSWFTSQTPIIAAAAPPQGSSSHHHNQGDRPAPTAPTRPLTGRVLALVLVSSREAEELWRGLLEKQLTPIYDRGSNHHHQSRPNVVVGRSIIDHAAAVGGTLVNGRYHSYPNGVSPVVIVQNIFQLDGLGKAWGGGGGRGGDGRIVDVGGMPIGFLNSIETVVLDGVESILTPPLSSTMPLGVWTLLRRLSQRGLSSTLSPSSTGGEDGGVRSRDVILEEQRSLPYLSRHGFTALWIISSSHTCTMLGASSSRNDDGPIGFHSAPAPTPTATATSTSRQFSDYYSKLQFKIDSQQAGESSSSTSSFIREVDTGSTMCCDVVSGRYDANSPSSMATIALSPLMAGNMHRNLIRLVGGLLGRGAMLECGQAEVGRWHSVVHRVSLAKALPTPQPPGAPIEAPPLASLIAHSISKIGKGTTVIVVKNKNDATALSTIVRLILSGAMRMPDKYAFPAEWWCGGGGNGGTERVLKFPLGNRNGAKTAKDLYTGMCALKSTAFKNGPEVSSDTLKLLKTGADKLLKSTPPTSAPEEGSATQINALELFDNNVVFVTEWHVKTGTYPKKLVDVRHVVNCLWDVASYRLLLPPSWQHTSSSSSPQGRNNHNNNNAPSGPPNITFELEGLTHTLSHLFGSHSYMNLFTTIVALDISTNSTSSAPSSSGDIIVGNKRERGDNSESGTKATDMLSRLAAFLVGTKQPVPQDIVNAIEDISLGL